MKKNLFLSATALLLLTLLFSCKKESAVKNPVTLMQNTGVMPADSNFVPFAVAASAAKQVNHSHLVSDIIAKKVNQQAINHSGINRSVFNLSGKQILDSLAVPDNINPSYYIFNYVGGGYVIMPADKRVEPVLSYSNDGYFPHSGTLPAGLVNWLSVNHKNMQILRKDTTLKQPARVARLWSEFETANTGIIRAGAIIRKALPPPPPCQDTWSSYTVGPLLKTTWGQGQPYNYLCPAGAYSNGHTPTGCVATAMAQLMYYWKAPARYNWSIMPLTTNYNLITYPGNQDVAQLMLDIGTSVSMLYHDSGSYPAPFNLVPPRIGPITSSAALKNNFGYRSATDASYNYLNVISNLDAGEPVLLGGTNDNTTILFWSFGADGHEWVCDGYQQINFIGCPGEPVLGESWLYLDMNWGWDGLSNAWYDFNYWSVFDGTSQKNWQYNQVMSYNIHP
ncbi:MAG: C10 family peptidase [Sphingobacteriales bacterium]